MENTVAVFFAHRKESIQNTLKLNDSFIKVENETKFMCLIFDARLTWNEHVNYIVDKCKTRLNLMRAIAGNRWGASIKSLTGGLQEFNTLHLRIWRCCARFYEQHE